jgi:hypothetical protein
MHSFEIHSYLNRLKLIFAEYGSFVNINHMLWRYEWSAIGHGIEMIKLLVENGVRIPDLHSTLCHIIDYPYSKLPISDAMRCLNEKISIPELIKIREYLADTNHKRYQKLKAYPGYSSYQLIYCGFFDPNSALKQGATYSGTPIDQPTNVINHIFDLYSKIKVK